MVGSSWLGFRVWGLGFRVYVRGLVLAVELYRLRVTESGSGLNKV